MLLIYYNSGNKPKILPILIVLLNCFIIIDAIENDNKKSYDNCTDCRLTSESIEGLIRIPRQMNLYGQIDDKIDLEKIKKLVCKDISDDYDREKCRHFYFTNLPTIQKWKNSSAKTKFFDFVCIKELKFCCPRNSFGPKCTKCIECNSNQHCHGEGTRQGNGTCVCKDGHQGPDCNSCSKGYYSKRDNSTIISCKPCHRSCLYCRHDGPLGCDVCQKGFTWLPSYGCSDVDECVKNKKICGENTFCVNTEGSYFCYECDRACDGCHGDGPDMCLRCATGYKLENNNCVAIKKTILPPEANYYRYGIYTGLLICTCIILHNNIYLASFIGLAVALYIGVSEYIMSAHLHDMETSNPAIR